jgi:hypothetical protein
VGRTGENLLVPGQDYRQGMAVPLNVFRTMTRVVMEETNAFD